jgi:hypothetical protein
MDTDQPPAADRDHEGPADDEREGELLMSLAHALQHISAEMEAIRQGLETVMQRQERAWAALKRQENLLLQISRAFREGEDESQDSGGGGSRPRKYFFAPREETSMRDEIAWEACLIKDPRTLAPTRWIFCPFRVTRAGPVMMYLEEPTERWRTVPLFTDDLTEGDGATPMSKKKRRRYGRFPCQLHNVITLRPRGNAGEFGI